MFDKMLDIIKNKDIVIPRLFLINYKNMNINDTEFVILVYLMNLNSNMYNPKDISDNLKIELLDVLTYISDMTEKGIIKIDMTQKSSKKVEVFNLDSLYEKLTFMLINEEKKEDNSIFQIFENEFARSLSPTEISLINEWREASYSDEIISEALKEAVINGVSNFKYIDKILDEWNKKNIRTKEDVEKDKKRFREQKKKNIQKEVFSYNWLDDEE